jgi:hypothetical protein
MGEIWFNAITASGSLLPTHYQTWATGYPGFLALPAEEQTPSADADQDGLSNLLAFAFHLGPLSNVPTGAQPTLVMSAGQVNLQFRRSKTADVNLAILVSSDLLPNNWLIQSQAGAVFTQIGGEPTAELVTVPLGAPGEGKFFRMRATQ